MRILFVAVLVFVPEILALAREKRQGKCSGDSFRCSNGQCISSDKVCDGAEDCSDSTDETQATCSKLLLECPPYAFRCAYGACIDKKSTCNGVKDCADNSDELLPECVQHVGQINNALCKKTEFTCNSGQCIDEFSVCDGNSDCYDGSDETITQCINVRCPVYTFQCAYGGCIDKSKKCNGVEDCKDGSDEDSELCVKDDKRPTLPPVRPKPPVYPSLGNSCLLPDKPKGGDYTVVGCAEKDLSPKCRRIPGTVVDENTIIRFSCHDGFVLQEKRRNSFCYNGLWDPEVPECQKLCPPLKSDTILDLTCVYLGNEVSCNQTHRPGTRAKARKCKPAYHPINDPSAIYTDIECLDDGNWAHPLFTCIPDCGHRNAQVEKLILHSPEAESEYPWHAGLYQGADHLYICGGTVITPKAILTAAHCVYIDSLSKVIKPSELEVAIGKYRRSWDVMDPNEQRFRILEIVIRHTYLGKNNRYEHDIAILAIEGSIIVQPTVMPACIDKLSHYELYRRPEALGTVVGWGYTEKGSVSDVLRVGKFHFYDFHSCRSKVSNDFAMFITYDKFCAGLPNGTSLAKGDSGGGLTFSSNYENKETHFIYGIVSIKDGNNNAITVFTNVTVHVDWIDKVIGAIEKRRT